MKRILSMLLLGCAPALAGAQQAATVTLEACRQAAVARSPLTVRQSLVTEKRKAQDRAVSSGLLPQLEINAQASYQNAVPELPADIPLPIALDLPKDQYRATVDLNQVIYNGHSIRNTKRVQAASAAVETASLEVELDRLRDRINRAYIGILTADKQLAVNRLMRETLESNIRATAARIRQGTTTGAQLASLEARRVELSQEELEWSGARTKYATELAELTGLPLSDRTTFAVPAVPATVEGWTAGRNDAPYRNRSEMKLYAGRRNLLEMQNRLLNSRSNPKLSLFASGGYGRPGYDFFDRNFSLMAIGGVRFQLPLTGWDATQKEKRVNRATGRDIDEQQRDFERNVSIAAAQYAVQIDKLREVTALDPSLVSARTKIREQALAQFQEGIITASDYLTEFNNEAAARIGAELNALRLVQAWVEYEAIRGNYD